MPPHHACIFGMETPLCERSGGHTGTAPTVSFGWIAYGRLILLGGLCANGYFVCVGLRGKILRSVVGAVPVCPPASPHRGASVVHSPCMMRVFLAWKRRCADVRAGTQAPPLRCRLGRLCVGWLAPLGGVAHKWLFCLHGIVWKNMMKWVGAAPVCPPVSPCKGASIVKYPVHDACVFGMETPLRGRSGGHTGTAPTVSFGQIAYGRLISLGGLCANGYFICVGVRDAFPPPMCCVMG